MTCGSSQTLVVCLFVKHRHGLGNDGRNYLIDPPTDTSYSASFGNALQRSFDTTLQLGMSARELRFSSLLFSFATVAGPGSRLVVEHVQCGKGTAKITPSHHNTAIEDPSRPE
jgi:hypothetical protein